MDLVILARISICLSVAGSDSKDAKIKKSLMAGYTSELLTQLVHYTENA